MSDSNLILSLAVLFWLLQFRSYCSAEDEAKSLWFGMAALAVFQACRSPAFARTLLATGAAGWPMVA
ncbi:hypothetical protein, partial [Enterococcus hirae]|uniref:hypothetical protein n=1 Tax=Enterococcus hirae TaxID=1354 RepID=UPI0019667B48